MRGQADEPGQNHSSESGSQQVAERLLRDPEHEGKSKQNSERGNDNGGLWGTGMIEAAETDWRPSGPGQGKQHAGTDIQGGIGSGERGGEDDEVHHVGGVRDFYEAEGSDEGALGYARVIPGHDSRQDQHGSDIDETEGEKGEPDGARSFLWGAGLSGCDRYHLDTAEAIDSEGHGD